MRKYLIPAVVLMAVASVLAEETVRLASIREMRAFLEQAGRRAEPPPTITEPTAPAQIDAAQSPPATVQAADAAATPPAPEFSLETAAPPAGLPAVLNRLQQSAAVELDAWLRQAVSERLTRNDRLAAARLYVNFALYPEAANLYQALIQSGGQTHPERQAVATGAAHVECALPLALLGQQQQATDMLTRGMEKARSRNDQNVLATGQNVLAVINSAAKVAAAGAELAKLAKRVPASVSDKRTEAARLLALICLYSGRNVPVNSGDAVAGGQAASRGRGRQAAGGGAQAAANTLGSAAVALSGASATTRVGPFDDVYPAFIRTRSLQALLAYKDAEAFREVLQNIADADALPMPRARAALLAELMARFPGHQVVKEGEAMYMLLRDLGASGMVAAGSSLAQLAAQTMKAAAPGQDGEFVYLAAEFAFMGKDWKRAYDGYRYLRAAFPEHRSVPLGVAGARTAEALKNISASGHTVIGQ